MKKGFFSSNYREVYYAVLDVDNAPILVFILYGEKDPSFIRNASKSWHAQESLSHSVAIPYANHIANQDNPEAFNKLGFWRS